MTNYVDFKTDDNGNYVLENGDLVMISGDEEIGQRARNNVKLFLGTWIYDTTKGTDYINIIFAKKSTPQQRIKEITRVLLDTEGINSIVSIEESRGIDINTLKHKIKARTDNGTIIGVNT